MEKYGNYGKRAPLPQVTWKREGRDVTTNGVGFAHAAWGLSDYISQAAIAVCSSSVSPFDLAREFRSMLDSGDAMGALAFAQKLLSHHGTLQDIAGYHMAFGQTMEVMRDLRGMEPYRHFQILDDLFVAWFLLEKDTLKASEVLMKRIVRQADLNRKAEERNRSPVEGPMEPAVTAGLVDYLIANPDRSVAEFRNRYPDSDDVQKWLDAVEAKLPH